MEKTESLIRGIGETRNFQKKYLNCVLASLSEDEKVSLEKLISFYETQGFSIKAQIDAYLLFLDDTMEESKYFIEHESYRYSKFEDVAKHVYFNQNYMMQYMLGLALSTYLWEQHLDIMRWFKTQLHTNNFDTYLEIGPGHGEYFLMAVKDTMMRKYVAIDISETSIALTENYVHYMENNINKSCEFLCEDFLTFKSEELFDMVVMGEVLEHVEEPVTFLVKMKKLLSEKGKILITVPINAPAKDHIYLFRNVEEVIEKVKAAGLEIEGQQCFMANGRDYNKAVKNKEAILMALVLKKNEECLHNGY